MEAVVIFDYEKQQDDEVNLKIGEVVTDVVNADEGWCEGTVNGVRGMFPDNFVQIQPAAVEKPPAPTPAPMVATTNDLGAPPLRDMKNKGRRAKVTFSYAAENTDELTLLPGQFVDVIAEEEEGWWRGRTDDGNEGLFPSNFVQETGTDNHDGGGGGAGGGARAEVIENVPREEKPAALEPARQSVLGLKLPTFNPAAAKANLRKTVPPPPKPEEKKQIPSLPAHPKAPEKPPEKLVERAKVVFDYVAEQSDELSISVGDVVEVLKKDQEGWWEVRLGDNAGMIPDNFVALLPAQQTAGLPRRPPAPSESKPDASPPSRPEAPPPSKPTPPPSREPLPSKPSAFKKSTEPKRPHPPPTAVEDEKSADFGVPTTAPLDSSAVKNRPKKSEDNIARPLEEPPPPHPQSAAQDNSKLSPWQEEIQKRKSGKGPVPRPAPKTAKPPPPGPKAAARPPAPEPEIKKRTASTSGKPPFTAKPPPTVKPEIKSSPPSKPAEIHKPPPPKPAEVKAPPPAKPAEVKIESHSPAHHPSPPQPTREPAVTEQSRGDEGGAWKEAFQKLRADFEEFKESCLKDIRVLTDDLDEERKARAMLVIDIDRLKKARGNR